MRKLESFIPIDRCRALASGRMLPERTDGAALFADISGSTPLAEALVGQLGFKDGAEEFARRLNQVYEALVAQVHGYGGTVIGFSGDAITCWYRTDDGSYAVSCALAMQRAMARIITRRNRWPMTSCAPPFRRWSVTGRATAIAG